MGLDMSIYRKDINSKNLITDGSNDDYDMGTEIAYWRKANQVRGWLVRHGVIEEMDDCVERPINRKTIGMLIDDCNKVISKFKATALLKDDKVAEDFFNTANKLLPPTTGFFFGSSEIDTYYMETLVDTVDMLTNILNTTNDDDVLTYVDSW